MNTSKPINRKKLFRSLRLWWRRTLTIWMRKLTSALCSLSLAAPQSGQMQQAIAHELERIRDLPGAIAAFRKAIVADPNLPGIHFELAEALHGPDSQADRKEAEHEYAIALEKNPREVQAAVRLGDLQADRGDLDSVAGLYQRVLSQQPNNAEASL